jgi:hypothetical protein
MWGNLFINENANIAGNETVYGVLTCDLERRDKRNDGQRYSNLQRNHTGIQRHLVPTNTYTGSANVKGNTNALTDLFVYGNAYALTDLVVTNTHLNGVLYATDISVPQTHTIGNVVAYGNVDAETNINVADSIYIANSVYSSGTVYCLTNLDVSGNAICHTDIDICGTHRPQRRILVGTLRVWKHQIHGKRLHRRKLLEKHPRPINKPPVKKTHILNHNRRIHQRAHRKLGVYRQRHQHERNLYVDGDISGTLNINLVGNAYISGIIDMSGTLSTYGNVDSRNTVNTSLRRRNRFGYTSARQHRHDKHL